jgi:hypothetical protein
MKNFLLETAKIVGTASEKAWSQVHTFSPTEKEKLSQRGHFLAVISLSELAEGVEVVAAGKELIARLHEEYYGQLEKEAVDQLKEAVATILEETKTEAKVEIEAAVLLGETIFFAIAGQGRVLLCRDHKIGLVLAGKEESVETAEGQVTDGDFFLLGSQLFFSLLKKDTIEAAFSAASPQEVAELITPQIHGREEDGRAAAAVLGVELFQESLPAGETRKAETGERKIISGRKWSGGLGFFREKWLWGKRVTAFLFQKVIFKIEKRLKRQAIYLVAEGKQEKKPQKTLMTVSVILGILLIVSVILGVYQRNRRSSGSGVNQILKQAQAKRDEGEDVIDLNPIRARQLLLESRDLLDEIKPEEVDQSVLDFRAELEKLLAQVMREHEVEPKVYYDLVIIKDGAKGDDWAISGGDLVIFDQEKKTIYSLSVTDKKAAILVGGDDLADGQQVAAFMPKVFLLSTRGIWQYDKETRRQGLVIEKDEGWGEMADFRAFGGNLYLLDKKGEIWKYPATETSFGAYRLWLKGEKPDFSDATAMAIDGSVWVLKKNGTILKFTQGGRDSFTLSGLDKPLNQPTALFTDDDQENLYILDKGNSRVVVINKSGEYHSQYLWQGMGEVTNIMASEENKKILLLAKNKVYEIEIK